jgi:hypothetical protein
MQLLEYAGPVRELIAQTVQRRLLQPARTILLAIGAILFGAALATIALQIEPGDRIVVGNTAGSLTAMLELDGARVLVGAGASRSHAADLLGRSTRPWERDIDLLILPGWDDYHVSGALGLLERRSVTAIAVVGIPGDEPSWTILERQAEQRDIPIRFVDRPHSLELSEDARLTIAQSSDHTGSWIRLERRGKRIDMIDAPASGELAPDRVALHPRNEHVVINLRDTREPAHSVPALIIVPQPMWERDFEEHHAAFIAEIQRNEQITLSFEDKRITLPLAEVEGSSVSR